ncbi:MAG: hypothetical protein KF802_03100 [Bdellovibrionaceae bacterium]|nr:hypothetical protein [Pseudobdellovibrionaceae bacterium]MBX3033392.1 hypothetical protein [Pseudobdellovibrionaceae bacterium]
MEIFRFNISHHEELNRQETFKQSVNLCPACGTVKNFEVQFTLEAKTEVHEVADCPACGHTAASFHPVH